MKNNIFPLCTLLLFCALFFGGCPENKPENPNQEGFTSGTLTLICDEEIGALLPSCLDSMKAKFPEAKVDMKTLSARSAMAQLLSGKARCIILARPYLKDESSLMKQSNVAEHKQFHLATDALVFYVSKNFPYDTLSAAALKNYFDNGQKNLFPPSKTATPDPEFVSLYPSSSSYANLLRYCTSEEKIHESIKLRYLSTVDSVKAHVAKKENAIGIGLLSSIAQDTARFKMLRIGFSDSAGVHRILKVHQSTVFRQMYPYPVLIVGYLLEDMRNLPYGVMSFLATDAAAQRSFLDAGIVPAYAKIRLFEEE